MQVQDKYQYQYQKNVLKYNLSTSTSTKYNKTANCSKLIRNQIKWNSIWFRCDTVQLCLEVQVSSSHVWCALTTDSGDHDKRIVLY